MNKFNSTTAEWWNNYLPFNEYELEILNKFAPHTRGDKLCLTNPNSEWWQTELYRIRHNIPCSKGLGTNLVLAETATFLIDQLFNKYLDDNTLLITSVVEHEAVDKNVERFNRQDKDHVRMHYYNGTKALNLSQVKEALRKKHYKKAFVYIIGTQITTGEITPTAFFIKLKEFLNSQNIESVMVLDDVHGMFLVPRDYSIFDHVIFTAHALIRRWDMGMCWSKEPIYMGCHALNWLTEYNSLLSFFLTRKDKLLMFSQVMEEEYAKYLSSPLFEYKSDSAPHIFSIKVNFPPRLAYSKDKWQEFADKEVRLETRDYEHDNIFYIRMRGSQFITFPELYPEAVRMVGELLDRVTSLNEDM